MDCPRCKLTNPESAQRCDCGYDFETKTVEKPYFAPGPSGVGGWLAFFIASLIAFSPIFTLGNLGREIDKSGPTPAFIIDSIISIALMSFGIYAGIRLLKIKPNAILIAKKYLIAVFVYAALVTILVILVGIYQPNDETLPSQPAGGFRPLIYAVIWYLYLKKSQRVLSTYGGSVEAIVKIPPGVVAAVQENSHTDTKSLAVEPSTASDPKASDAARLIAVISIPPSADIELDGAFLGSTPSELWADSGRVGTSL